MTDPLAPDRSRRATIDQWLNLLSESTYLVGLLEKGGSYALRRAEVTRLPHDGYPSSSMPENSSIAGGRTADPTGVTVTLRAGGREAKHDPDGSLVKDATSDIWGDGYDSDAAAAQRMERAGQRAANQFATAVDMATGFPAIRVTTDDGWYTVTTTLELHVAELVTLAQGGDSLTGHARTRMEGAALDGCTALREAVGCMNKLLDEPAPMDARERCLTCSEPRDVITWFGANPHQWIVSETMCRTDATRKHRQERKRRAS